MNGLPFDRLRANERSKMRRKRKTLGFQEEALYKDSDELDTILTES